jgi:outer membrane protein assembly complex protein YaeT
MRGRLASATLVAVLSVLNGWAAAQPSESLEVLLGRPITTVAVEIDGSAENAADVRALLETQVGELLAMSDVRESVFHLASVGRYDEVVVEGRPDGGGVALGYRLVTTRRITGMDFTGTLGVPARRLRQALGTRPLGVPTEDRLRGAERALRSVYESLGYFNARVTASMVAPGARVRSVLVFDVNAGPRARIATVDVQSNGWSRAEALDRLGLAPGDPWDAPALEARAQAAVAALREQGRYASTISWDVRRRDDGQLVDVTIDAAIGPLVELTFDSPDVAARRLRELVPIEREGSVDEDLLEDSKRLIERYLHDEGYARAVVDYARVELDGRVRIAFQIARGPRFEVERVVIEGVGAARLADVQALVALDAGAPFSDEALAASAASVAEYYRVRGFTTVRVETSISEGSAGPDDATRSVLPRLVVHEGPVTLVGPIVLNGVVSVEEEELRRLMGLRTGTPFYAPQLVADRNAMAAYYLNRGYRDVRVDAIPRPAPETGALEIVFEITEGPQYVVGHVLVAGYARTDPSTIRRELNLVQGAPLGADDLAEAQRRLNALGLFRRVRVEELPQPGRLMTDIAVTVEEAPATSIGYGIGVEGGRRLVRDPSQAEGALERVEISPRGFFEVGRRNLWGKNRSISLFTRFSLRDRGGSEDSTQDDSSFYEFRVVGTYREPRAFGTEADVQVSGFVEQGVRSSFNFARQGVNAETARQLRRQTTLVGRYGFGKTRLFDQRLVAEEKPVVDRLFPQVRLSTLSGVIVRDTRDDPLDPASGYVANVEGDLSARSLGSEVGFVKAFAQGFVYRELPGALRVVLAGGARVGLATAFGVDTRPDESGQPVEVEVKDLPASERFYAGGSTTVRGYALDRLGDDATIDSDGFPQGGNALVIVNGELRFPIWRALGGVVFVDAGNVFARAGDLDLSSIKASAGTGVRYRSPIGPIRVDLGVKLDPRTFANQQREGRWEVHVSLGQAF